MTYTNAVVVAGGILCFFFVGMYFGHEQAPTKVAPVAYAQTVQAPVNTAPVTYSQETKISKVSFGTLGVADVQVREMCYSGIVYLVSSTGFITPKVTRGNGHEHCAED